MSATSTSTATTVVNGRLRFPPVAASSSVLSADELAIRQDRTVPFDPSALQFVLSPPDPAPALVGSIPSAGASNVPRTAWLRLTSPRLYPLPLSTGSSSSATEAAHPTAAHAVEPALIVIDPEGELPVSAPCALIWVGPEGAARSESRPRHGAPATVFYDRTDRARTPPFPDDYWLAPDPATETGHPGCNRRPRARAGRTAALQRADRGHQEPRIDSAPLAASPSSCRMLPARNPCREARRHRSNPLASVQLFDLTPGSASYGDRVPFLLNVASVGLEGQPLTHSLVLYPSIPLAWRGRYGLAVTKRVLASPSRPFAPSAFFEAALAPAEPGRTHRSPETRTLAGEVLDALERRCLRRSSGRTSRWRSRFASGAAGGIPERPPRHQGAGARWTGTRVHDHRRDTRFGTRGGDPDGNLGGAELAGGRVPRCDENGDPRITRTQTLPFTLALPRAALEGPVPLIMLQHGGGGSAEGDIPFAASSYLAEAGFAVIGFTDVFTRELGPDQDTQNLTIFAVLLAANKPPDFWVQTGTGSSSPFCA